MIPVVAGVGSVPAVGEPGAGALDGHKKVIRTLTKKHIKIGRCKIGNETSVKDHVITIDKNITKRSSKE